MYFVVEFLKDRMVVVISHQWFLGNNTAAWPLTKGVAFRKMLTQHSFPEEGSYVIKDVRILKSAKTLQSALTYERRAQYESAFTSSETTKGALSSDEKRKKKPRVTYFSDSDSEGDNACEFPPEKLFQYSPFKENSIVHSTLLSPSTSRTRQPTDVLRHTSDENVPPPLQTPIVSQILDELAALRAENAGLRLDLRHCLEKLVVIENTTTRFQQFMQDAPPVLTPATKQTTPTKYRLNLPLRSREELHAFDEQLNDTKLFNKLVSTLSQIPRGTSISECVKSTCCFVFSHELALQANWIGANGKEALQHTELQRAIIDAICSIQNVPEQSRGKVEHSFKRWFQNGGDRRGGRLLRRKAAALRKALANNPKDVDMDLSDE